MHKKSIKRKLTGVIIFLIFTAVFFIQISNEAKSQETAGSGEDLAIVLLIDISGSVSYTDPENLRQTAANIFIDLLEPTDSLCVIAFDDQVDVIVPFREVGVIEQRNQIKRSLSDRLEPRGNTDYTTALLEAYQKLEDYKDNDKDPIVVFLTDGDINPIPGSRNDDAFMASYMESFWELIGNFTLREYPIYTVGFSDEVDPEVLKRISMNTKGDFHILNDSTELLESFFKLLGSMKGRKGFIEETYEPEKETAVFNFFIDNYTRKVNMVLISEQGNHSINLNSPLGEELNEGIRVIADDKYTIMTINNYDIRYLGPWQAEIIGNDSIKVMMDKDYSVNATLVKPAPFGKYSLNEDLEFKVKIKQEDSRIQDLELKAFITKPGEIIPKEISMENEADYFVGSYDAADRVGDYEIELQVLFDNQIINTAYSKIHIKALPYLAIDSWADSDIRTGEEILINASINISGNRLIEGKDIDVQSYCLYLSYEDGEVYEINLHDSGLEEHYDLKEGDGIWSNLVSFKNQGLAKAMLFATGEYLGEHFMISKNLGEHGVYPPGKIYIEPIGNLLYATSGKSIVINLLIKNESKFREALYINADKLLLKPERKKIIIEPGEIRKVTLEFDLKKDIENAVYDFPLYFEAEYEFTEIFNEELILDLSIVSGFELIIKRINFSSIINSSIFSIALIIIATVAALYVSIYFLGFFMALILVKPQIKLNGKLIYSLENKIPKDICQEEAAEKVDIGELDLSKKKKNKILIAFGKINEGADLYFKKEKLNYELKVEAIQNKEQSLFLQGWKALFRKGPQISVVLAATPPGVIEKNGDVFTSFILEEGAIFSSGGVSFKYYKKPQKWFKKGSEKEQENILGDRIHE